MLGLGLDVHPLWALVVLVVVVAVWQYVAVTRRRSAFVALERRREWQFRSSDPRIVSRYDGDPFGRGRNRMAENVVKGRFEGRTFVAFDYSYETGGGKRKKTHHHSVVVLEHGMPARMRIPRLEVTPQGTVGRWFSGALGTDVQVGDPALDDALHVRTDHPEFARDLLAGDLVEVALQHHGRAWRLERDALLLFEDGSHTAPEVEGVLEWGAAILDGVPDRVWARLRGDG